MGYEKLNLKNGTILTEEHIAHIEDGIKNAAEGVDIINTTPDGDTVYKEPWTLGYINAEGNVYESTSLAHTNQIAVAAGDVIAVTAKENANTVSREARFLAAYNKGVIVPDAGGQNLSSYTVPAGVDGVVISVSSYNYYTDYTVTVTHNNEQYVCYPKREPMNGWTKTGGMTDGSVFVFPEQNVKTRKVFVFSGNVVEFGSLTLGRKVDGVYAERVVIDAENVTIYNTYGATNVQAHGLTIAGNVQVIMTTETTNRLSKLAISSCGLRYEATNLHNITWNGDKGNPVVESNGSVLTDCVAMWTCRTKNKPVWVFGDSYITLAQERWPYYLIKDGFDAGCMLSGYAGENSANAFESLKSLLQIGRPQYILWCLGMNDGDSTNAVSSAWESIYTRLKSVCANYGITLVLATIPTTPTVNNEFKNAIVRNSGCRYVDFAKAVNATPNGEWIGGTLSSDNVHPTTQGAICLYHRVLGDFPEIANL